VIGGERTLDFRKPLLPDVWGDASGLNFLSERERLTVNHIRSRSDLYFFA
jgi:hypothetical protein